MLCCCFTGRNLEALAEEDDEEEMEDRRDVCE